MILRTDKLAVGYGKKTVVGGIDIALLKGQFVCLLGPNGCGKSTILKTIVRMLMPLGGEVFISDQAISKMSNQDMAKMTAVVLTDPVSAGLLTAYDVVMLGRHPHTGFTGRPTAHDGEKVIEVLGMVNAETIAHRYFGELSDGEKQKVLLARALAQEPQLIVLDEPTSHLDARHRIEVMLILRQLSRDRGVTVIASLHDIDLAMKACDVAILVKDERILACGTPEDVLNEKLVTQLYGLERAMFDTRLGGVELRGKDGGQPVFVVAGGGSGAAVYRALVKHGFNIITGVLSENDIDCRVATSVGATVVKSPAFEDISQKNIAEAVMLIGTVRQVIDAGFPVGSANRQNIELLRVALAAGVTVHTLRRQVEAEGLFGPAAAGFTYSHDFFELVSAVKRTADLSP
jgi:iron complex transport system ATP-binding protein